MVLIDTHIAVFLHSGDLSKISPPAIAAMESNDIVLPELARLELQYLYEIKRIGYTPEQIVSDLYIDIGVTCSTTPIAALIQTAIGISWTRDVFDRLIVADAMYNQKPLISRDKLIIEKLPDIISAR